MRNVLVIGGAGFVGSNLCERLEALGLTVTSLDNYSTGSENNHIDNVTYIRGEASEAHLLQDQFDTIFHLGEYSRVEQSYDDIDTVLNNNVYSINSVVKLAKKNNAKLIYSGSSTKFSKEGGSLSPYAWSKVVNVDFIKNYHLWYGLDYAITYFYNVYGKNEISNGKYSTVVAKFLNLKKTGSNSLPVTLPGTQRRNFTHVDDIIDGLILVAKNGHGDGYGIGSHESFSILELAEMIGLDVDFQSAKRGNRIDANVESKKTLGLGWTPKRNLKEYIEQCLKQL